MVREVCGYNNWNIRREVWKYGERGYRYAQLDLGHALSAVVISAKMLGWDLSVIHTVSDKTLRTLFGLTCVKPEEDEVPSIFAVVSPQSIESKIEFSISKETVKAVEGLELLGKPNDLSRNHHKWEIVESITNATRKLVDSKCVINPIPKPSNDLNPKRNVYSGKVIRQRRSATEYNPSKTTSVEQFFTIISKTIPQLYPSFWASHQLPLSVHLGIFVYRVDNLPSGYYILLRDKNAITELTKIISDGKWTTPSATPKHLKDYFFLLREDKSEKVANESSRSTCKQNISKTSAFSFCCIAKLETTITQEPHLYNTLYHECGSIGQLLYLEAEACGLQATGLGCYVDPVSREIFSLQKSDYYPFYHLAIGSTDFQSIGWVQPFNYERKEPTFVMDAIEYY